MATTLPARPQMRPVTLWDAQWMVLDHPSGVEPIIEIVRTYGYEYPATDTVTCPNGHTWTAGTDRHGRRKLPEGVLGRYRVEMYDPDMGDTYGYDPYWVCGTCDAEVQIEWLHTGPVSFPVQHGEKLFPNDLIRLRLIDSPGGFHVATPLTSRYPLGDADGATVCEIAPQEMSVSHGWEQDDAVLQVDTTRVTYSQQYTLEAQIVSEPREALPALLRAVYGDHAPVVGAC